MGQFLFAIIKEMRKICFWAVCLAALSFAACQDDDTEDQGGGETGLSEEYYTGGKLGTAFTTNSSAYEQPAPAVENNGMSQNFLNGEALFEKPFTSNASGVRHGLGPLYIRSSCIHCHPGYGHGKRIEGKFNTNEIGNGYLLVIVDEEDSYIPTFTGMPQTKAVYPYKAPIDEDQINIKWLAYTDEYGNKFPDGEPYSLIYPEVEIPQSAYYILPGKDVQADGSFTPIPLDKVIVKLEATIGIYGTGLLDAIPDDSLRAEYARQQARGYCQGKIGKDITEEDGTTHPARYTYGLTRGTLQNGAGANAAWNITNVTRSDRRYHYITTAYARQAAQDREVQKALGQTEEEIYNGLMSTSLEVEMTDQEYIDLMIWHRGLAVPAARDLEDETVQQGKKLFYSIGCTACHRPSWQTGEDDYKGSKVLAGKLPRYPNQKIWPYTDLLQHRLEMVNDIRTGWCRTTPLWGRGLSDKCTGAGDHLHDMRARNYIEAIMWHGGEAAKSRENFYNLSREDRNAVVKFLEAI